MEHLIFKHMETVKDITEKSLKRIPEEAADFVPDGFNNSIRWNFGHIVYIQEKIAFLLLKEKSGLPASYEELFSAGTSPRTWKQEPPSLREIAGIMADQKDRILQFMPGRLEETLPEPFTNKAGTTFHTAGEAFLFSFYHEALHMEAIKKIYQIYKKEKV
ncbi:DinB family protein [Bacillus infantis]|uniref:DinB family protein n=1 Tax=Bacillus infantis TaxID=324767 RepID=UPI00209C711D|nr:DinB family protein [Bacillus infantis]MCP1158386.1 DinB family protein [Bacillus infantis]MCR6610838.1 DinB family protein [Bacillus infantis]